MSTDCTASFIVCAITTLVVSATTVGNYCVTFLWQALGFVLSLAASFPSFCVEYLAYAGVKVYHNIVVIITTTTTKTYLVVIVLCMIYLKFSKTFRYPNRGLSLFSLRFYNHQARANNLHFDGSFESDFEYSNNSDADDAWLSFMADDNDDEGSDDDVTNDNSSNTDDTSDVDNNSDSDEYTVVMEESDSDVSVNSQTFSTRSNIRGIEIQLPPLDIHCSRSSTPSHVPKTMNSPEEFYREIERERDKRKCVVCQMRSKSVLILPCRHMCMCILCADQIVRSRGTGRRVCPLCRTKITKVMNIYV